MKKVIGRKLYDTDTAEIFAIYENGQQINSFYYIREQLYCKTDGEYFLYCKGGAGTHYAKQYIKRCNAVGETIVPLTKDRAKEWIKSKDKNKLKTNEAFIQLLLG